MKENSYIIDAWQELPENILIRQSGNAWLYVILLYLLALKQVMSIFALFVKKMSLRFFICWNAFQQKEKKEAGKWGVRGGKAAVWARQPLSKGWDLSFQYLNLIICLRQNYIPFQLPLPYSKLFQFKTNLVKLGHWWIIVRCSYLEAEFTLEKSL